jgi:hypothetical protein
MPEDANKPCQPAPGAFDFPTPDEIEAAKKAGIIIENDRAEDFSQLAALLRTTQ